MGQVSWTGDVQLDVPAVRILDEDAAALVDDRDRPTVRGERGGEDGVVCADGAPRVDVGRQTGRRPADGRQEDGLTLPHRRPEAVRADDLGLAVTSEVLDDYVVAGVGHARHLLSVGGHAREGTAAPVARD